MIKKYATLLLIALLVTGCTSKQLYDAGQDIKCQEYYKDEDYLYKTKCEKESYEDYQRKRESLLKERRKDANSS
jgi:hypothetical protein